MNFTNSLDGVMRANVHLKIRLDKEKLDTICEYANAKKKSYREIMQTEAELAIELLISEIRSGDRK